MERKYSNFIRVETGMQWYNEVCDDIMAVTVYVYILNAFKTAFINACYISVYMYTLPHAMFIYFLSPSFSEYTTGYLDKSEITCIDKFWFHERTKLSQLSCNKKLRNTSLMGIPNQETVVTT